MMKVVPIKQVVPDANQPRKYFDATKLSSLRESIKKHGIRNPLVVEDVGTGKYLLTDGERRYRAATELGLKEVPVIVNKALKEVDRLIIQFNIQEQHEGWTSVEKANALVKIAEEMGVTLADATKLLNVPTRTAQRYIAFAGLVDKDHFVRSMVPMDYAVQIQNLKHVAIAQSENVLEEKFSRNEEKRLEQRVVDLILKGDISKKGDIVKIKDSFTKNPKLITKFLEDDKMGSLDLYKLAKAKGAYHLRNLMNNAMWVNSHGRRYMENADVPLTPAQATVLKESRAVLAKVVGLVD